MEYGELGVPHQLAGDCVIFVRRPNARGTEEVGAH